ncbi:MAG: hypothetical protein WBB35_11605, partial [Saprospiraceae bacterium]
MRRLLLMIVVMACLVKGEKVWGQDPMVVRLQINACGTQEIQGEFFQFITGSQSFNIGSSSPSISVTVPSSSTTISMNSFQGPTQAFLDALNAKISNCNPKLFVDPYKSPY